MGVVSPTPGLHLPPWKTQYPIYRRLGGPQGRSGRAEILVPTGIRSQTLQPVVSRYTNWATGSIILIVTSCKLVDSSWNVMAHGDARVEKWRGNWRMEWVASTLHTTSEHGVSSITTADANISAASSRLNWRPPRRFKWTRPFRRKTKYGFCACAITFQLACTLAKMRVVSPLLGR